MPRIPIPLPTTTTHYHHCSRRHRHDRRKGCRRRTGFVVVVVVVVIISSSYCSFRHSGISRRCCGRSIMSRSCPASLAGPAKDAAGGRASIIWTQMPTLPSCNQVCSELAWFRCLRDTIVSSQRQMGAVLKTVSEALDLHTKPAEKLSSGIV